MRALSEPAARILRGLAHDGAIAVTHTTAANLEFARNWYLHLQRAGVRNYALIATDDDAHATLAREVVGHVVAYPLGPTGAAQVAQSYRSRGWTRLMFAVPRMLHWVLAMGLDVLWMDTDVVALSDPFPLIIRLALVSATISYLYTYEYILITVISMLVFLIVNYFATEWKRKFIKEKSRKDQGQRGRRGGRSD